VVELVIASVAWRFLCILACDRHDLLNDACYKAKQQGSHSIVNNMLLVFSKVSLCVNL
jgi:hypothetical protein